MENPLELRKKIKSKMPKFVRSDAHKKKKLAPKWRKPKGRQNKMRLKKKGYHKTVKIGYGSPAKIKHILKSGLKGILISSLKDIENINPKTEGIIISKKVGLKKKIEIIKKAKELSLKIINIKDPDLFIKENEEKLKTKKASKEKITKEKEEKKKEAEEKAKKKEAEEEKTGGDELAKKVEEEEEKKKEEEKKILTKKE